MGEIELQTLSMSYGSAAIARYQHPDSTSDVVVFVEGAAPGEKVRAKILKQHKNYWRAEVTEVLVPSNSRVTPKCSVFGACGGCQWQHIAYDEQVAQKSHVLIHQIHKVTRIEKKNLESMLEVHAAQNPWAYRSRLQVRGDNKGLGFFEGESHKIVHTNRCEVAHSLIQQEWEVFLKNEEHKKFNGKPFKIEWAVQVPEGVTKAVNREHSAFGFSQINPAQNEVLRKIVFDMSSKYSREDGLGFLLLDLFGGSGNLSDLLKDHFQNIVCVDRHNGGITGAKLEERLKKSEAQTSKGKKHIICSDVDEFLKGRYWGQNHADQVIVDPPRAGLSKHTINNLLELKPEKIIYVSCDPSTFSRDLNILLQQYRLKKLHLVDMFPQTYHMEIAAELGL